MQKILWKKIIKIENDTYGFTHTRGKYEKLFYSYHEFNWNDAFGMCFERDRKKIA